MNQKTSQTNLIRKALQRGEKLTSLDALKRFECMRLGARIHDLKTEGMNIVTSMVTTESGKRVAQYSKA